MRSASERLQLISIEFLNALGEEEVTRQSTLGSESKSYKGYFSTYGPQVLPIMLELVPQVRSEEDYFDEWCVSKSSGYVIALIAKLCSNKELSLIMVFVKTNLLSEVPVNRYASIFVLGCTLETIYSSDILKFLVTQYPALLSVLKDQNAIMRATTAWLMIKIAESHSTIFGVNDYLSLSLNSFMESLADKNSIAVNICYAISTLAKRLGDRETIKNNSLLIR